MKHKAVGIKNECIAQSGFTLWEMLFVVGILAVFYALVIGNYGQSRVAQNLKNAQYEMITNIQKARSYSLSGRHIQGFSPKYYIVKIEAPGSGGTVTSYSVQGIAYDAGNNVDVQYDGNPNDNLETIPLPQTVSVKELKLWKGGVAQTDPTCVQIAFAVPYGKTYISENCAIDQIYTNGSEMSDRANSKLSITLQRAGASDERKVVVYGLSGRVEAE
jgi:prepilin-type N-terminal cleavage/methylation domain-containing protein